MEIKGSFRCEDFIEYMPVYIAEPGRLNLDLGTVEGKYFIGTIVFFKSDTIKYLMIVLGKSWN
jgi:hypothetical protein